MVLPWEKRMGPPFLAGYAFFTVVGLISQCSFLFIDLNVKNLLFCRWVFFNLLPDV